MMKMDDLPHWYQFVRDMLIYRDEKESLNVKVVVVGKAGEKLSNYKRSGRI